MKIHIEKNSVQETLIIPLYGRKICAEKFPELYTDTSAKRLCKNLDYDFSALEAQKDSFVFEFGALEAAMRQLDIMWELRDFHYSNSDQYNAMVMLALYAFNNNRRVYILYDNDYVLDLYVY